MATGSCEAFMIVDGESQSLLSSKLLTSHTSAAGATNSEPAQADLATGKGR